MKPINKKYYLSLDKILNEELYKASLDILNKGIRDDIIATTIERKTSVENSGILLKEAISGYYVLDESIPYGEFLKQVQVATGLPIVMHKALCDYNRTNTLDKACFNRNTLTKFILEFQLWFEEAFLKRFSYKALNVESLETALTDINGEVKEKIVQGTVGIIRDDSLFVPENFLYDKVVSDSPKEKDTVQRSNIDEVVVFGKIPRRSVQVPLYFGGTTSLDLKGGFVSDREYILKCNVNGFGKKLRISFWKL